MLVDQLSNKRVLVVGDVMVDFFVSGRVDRVSPEAPALVLNVESEISMIGGAGNVAANIVSLGGVAILCGVIGSDSAAGLVEDWIGASDGRMQDLLVRSKSRPTTTKTRYVAGDRHLLRTDREKIGLTAEDADALAKAIETFDHGCDAIVISDYVKGVVCDTVMEAVRALAARKKIPLIVDPKRRDLRMYRGATILTPNEKELQSFVTAALDCEDDFAQAAQHCREVTGADVLLTRSERGVTLFASGATPWNDPAHARRVRDVSGAGDTVTAALALCLAARMDLQVAARVANLASSIAVEQSGTTRVEARDLHLRLLRSEDENTLATKLTTLDEARALRDEWRKRGLRVGFTNGCFDLLHPGHVQLLQEARRQCDCLIVALNTDASVKRLKGETRPIQSEAARAVVIGALESVDLVLFFDEDTPLEIIRALLPDVLFKGADYTVDTVVGADEVMEAGGEVLLISLVAGHSTTRLIKRSNTPANGPAAAVS